MGKILTKTDDLQDFNNTNFKFSAIRVDKLKATEYTLVTIILDMSYSVKPFRDLLAESMKNVIESCRKSPRANNLLVRVVTFNNQVFQEHGFVTLNSIDSNGYNMMMNPRGATALYDATIDGLTAMDQYAEAVYEGDIDANGILFVITDGDDNQSSSSVSDVADKVKQITRKEEMESIQMFLIGINNSDSYFKQYLESFKNTAGFTDFIDAGDATPEALARLAQFVSKSISNQSQALGTGGPSQSLVTF